MTQLREILEFCEGAEFFMVKYENSKDGDLGKILEKKELDAIDLSKQEVHRSIRYKNDDTLFIYDLKPNSPQYVDNNLQLLKRNLEEAKVIEMVYPGVFKWLYDGISIKACAIIPSGSPSEHSTMTRYGGTERFYKILRKHLENIAKMNRGVSPDYDFIDDAIPVPETTLSCGSVNIKNGLYNISVNPKKDTWLDVLRNSQKNLQHDKKLTRMSMKYWSREINPDFISEAKHIKLKESISIEEAQHNDLYPQPIKKLMAVHDKGNYNRYLLSRFLLSVHSPKDAKFVYYSVLSDEEREHVKHGNCSTQWNYIMNNMDRYDCPTNSELKSFIDQEYNQAHPLEGIQLYLDKREDDNDGKKETIR